jgi:hypothetical protein
MKQRHKLGVHLCFKPLHTANLFHAFPQLLISLLAFDLRSNKRMEQVKPSPPSFLALHGLMEQIKPSHL